MKGCITCLWFKTIEHGRKARCDAMVYDKTFNENTTRYKGFTNIGRIKNSQRLHTPCSLFEYVGAI